MVEIHGTMREPRTTMTDPTICLIEITYLPKPRKESDVREAIDDAVSELFEERLSDLCEGAESTARYVKRVNA